MTVMPEHREWTVEDLDDLPDDGLHYELLDGTLLVTGSCTARHQVAVGELYLLLRQACPSELRVMLAPFAYRPTRRRSFLPDLLVTRREDVLVKEVTAPLLLAVEVLSPSTRSVDLVLKRNVYEESGVQAYWVIDPDVPSVRAFELVEGAYVEAGSAQGDEELTLDLPFPVSLTPSQLLDGIQ